MVIRHESATCIECVSELKEIWSRDPDIFGTWEIVSIVSWNQYGIDMVETYVDASYTFASGDEVQTLEYYRQSAQIGDSK